MLSKFQVTKVQQALVNLGLVVEGYLPEGEWDAMTNTLYWRYATNTPPFVAANAIGFVPGDVYLLHPGVVEAVGGAEAFYDENFVAPVSDEELDEELDDTPALDPAVFAALNAAVPEATDLPPADDQLTASQTGLINEAPSSAEPDAAQPSVNAAAQNAGTQQEEAEEEEYDDESDDEEEEDEDDSEDEGSTKDEVTEPVAPPTGAKKKKKKR